MKLAIANSGKLVRVNLDGYETRAVPIAAADHGRAVALVFAGFGDGPEVATKIVNAYNAHDALVDALKNLRALVHFANGDSRGLRGDSLTEFEKEREPEIETALKLAGVES